MHAQTHNYRTGKLAWQLLQQHIVQCHVCMHTVLIGSNLHLYDIMLDFVLLQVLRVLQEI